LLTEILRRKIMFERSVNTTVKIKSMSCMHCVKRVEDTLKALKGVKKVKADLASGSASVDYVESKISRDELVKAVNEAGFSAQ